MLTPNERRARSIFVRPEIERLFSGISTYEFFVYSNRGMETIRQHLGKYLISPIVGIVESFLWNGDCPQGINSNDIIQYVHSKAYRMNL